MAIELLANEMHRYDRQILISDIGEVGQKKLKAARVCIIGAGGLGSPAAFYLAAAGVGTLHIIDHDRVVLNNLNRQILHGESDIGRFKVESAKDTLLKLNSTTNLILTAEKIVAENAATLVAGSDLIIDALDNMDTRYVLNKTALDLEIPFIHGAAMWFEGRVLTVLPHKGACLRCLYRGPLPETTVFPIIGVIPAVIGAIQATEAIKYILGIGELLVDRLLRYDGLNAKWTEFKIRKNPSCTHCGQAGERNVL